jgi:predicted RNA-binding Zn ribbon-like protein
MRGAATVLLTTPAGGSFRFDPGALCFELLLTGGEGHLARYETLHAPEDLARWLAASSLAVAVAPVGPDDLERARRFRAALWRVALAGAAGRRPERADLAAINRAAADPPLVPRIDEDGRHARSWATPATARQALSTIARDAIDVFGSERAARVRVCAGPTCDLAFLDTSRPGARRWCSMERCGNHAKVRAHRARRRATPPAGGAP